MEPLIKYETIQTLLYLPESSEYSNEIDSFGKEDYTNSLTFQMD